MFSSSLRTRIITPVFTKAPSPGLPQTIMTKSPSARAPRQLCPKLPVPAGSWGLPRGGTAGSPSPGGVFPGGCLSLGGPLPVRGAGCCRRCCGRSGPAHTPPAPSASSASSSSSCGCGRWWGRGGWGRRWGWRGRWEPGWRRKTERADPLAWCRCCWRSRWQTSCSGDKAAATASTPWRAWHSLRRLRKTRIFLPSLKTPEFQWGPGSLPAMPAVPPAQPRAGSNATEQPAKGAGPSALPTLPAAPPRAPLRQPPARAPPRSRRRRPGPRRGTGRGRPRRTLRAPLAPTSCRGGGGEGEREGARRWPDPAGRADRPREPLTCGGGGGEGAPGRRGRWGLRQRGVRARSGAASGAPPAAWHRPAPDVTPGRRLPSHGRGHGAEGAEGTPQRRTPPRGRVLSWLRAAVPCQHLRAAPAPARRHPQVASGRPALPPCRPRGRCVVASRDGGACKSGRRSVCGGV